jgi:hypothetical protein
MSATLPIISRAKRPRPLLDMAIETIEDAGSKGQKRNRSIQVPPPPLPVLLRVPTAGLVGGEYWHTHDRRGRYRIGVQARAHSQRAARQHRERICRGEAADGPGVETTKQRRRDLRTIRHFWAGSPRTGIHSSAGRHGHPGIEQSRRRIVLRATIGKSFEQGRFGRVWSPMLELLAARPLGTNATTEWDVLPEVQVTLNRRQHIRLGAGIGVPVTQTDHRRKSAMFYLLWDWYEGGFFQGW